MSAGKRSCPDLICYLLSVIFDERKPSRTSVMSNIFGFGKKKAAEPPPQTAGRVVDKVLSPSEIALAERIQREQEEALREHAEQQGRLMMERVEKMGRLKGLLAQDPDTWKISEMKAALKAEGVDTDSIIEKVELRRLTKELLETSPLLKAEAEAIAKAAEVAAAKEAALKNAEDQEYSERLARARSSQPIVAPPVAESVADGGQPEAGSGGTMATEAPVSEAGDGALAADEAAALAEAAAIEEAEALDEAAAVSVSDESEAERRRQEAARREQEELDLALAMSMSMADEEARKLENGKGDAVAQPEEISAPVEASAPEASAPEAAPTQSIC